MSTNQYSSTCPNCEQDMTTDQSNKPFDTISHECNECGFYAYTQSGYRDLAGLNDLRKSLSDEEYTLHPLEKLPEQDPEYGESP